jgi:murein DD-endopeptidase MepM/ murein hydrolase activator NlpD
VKALVSAGSLVAVVSAGLLAVVALSACGGSGESAGVSVTLVAPTPSPRPSSVGAPTRTPTADVGNDGAGDNNGESDSNGEFTTPEVSGLIYPIAGACLPANYDLMPNAPREYRAGVHEGVDFYGLDNCVPIDRGTPVLAVADGQVIRADLDYVDLTLEELDQLNQRVAQEGTSAPAVLDRFRGRQVWIDHGGGLVTRYAHLDSIESGIADGIFVQAGEVIGYVGESGTPESVTDPGTEYHLHFEIRVGHTYLGQGLPPDVVRALYERAFSP